MNDGLRGRIFNGIGYIVINDTLKFNAVNTDILIRFNVTGNANLFGPA